MNDALELGRAHHQSHPARIPRKVLGDDVDASQHQIANHPGTDAPVRAGDEHAIHSAATSRDVGSVSI
jgi:hypothetical protein